MNNAAERSAAFSFDTCQEKVVSPSESSLCELREISFAIFAVKSF